MNLSLLIVITIIFLLVFIFWLIMNFIKKIKQVKSGEIVIPPIPTQITTKDANYFIRFAFGVVIILIMSGFLYYSTTSSLPFNIGKIGLIIIWIILFLLAYFISKISRKCKIDGLKLEEWTKDTAWRYYRCPRGHVSKEKIVPVRPS